MRLFSRHVPRWVLAGRAYTKTLIGWGRFDQHTSLDNIAASTQQNRPAMKVEQNTCAVMGQLYFYCSNVP
jgi:serine protease inhibitor ecotin